MKKFLLFLLFMQLFAMEAFGQSDISCGEGNCNIPPSTDVQYTGGGSNYTSFDLVPLSEDVNITTDEGDRPENTRASAQFNSLHSESFNADLSGQDEGDAGSIFLVTDIVDQITLMLDGAMGDAGMSSSEICGENFMTGVYGTDAQTYFNNRRAADPELSNECDLEDIEWVNSNKFMCPGGFEESPTANVDVTRYQARRQCQGNIQTTRCVKRSYTVSCESNRIMDRCCDEAPYSWDDKQGDGTLTPPYSNATCNPTKCSQLGESTWYESGEVAKLEFEAWEHEIISMAPDELCKLKKNQLEKPLVYYSTTVREIEGDENSPLVPGPDVNYTETLTLDNDGNFVIPIPDVVNFPNSDTPNTLSASDVRVKIHKNESTLEVANCFGLDGSDLTDRECERVHPGEAANNGLVISFLNKLGVESNKLYISVQSSSKRNCSLVAQEKSYTFYFSNRIDANGYSVAEKRGQNYNKKKFYVNGNFWGGAFDGSYMTGRWMPGENLYYVDGTPLRLTRINYWNCDYGCAGQYQRGWIPTSWSGNDYRTTGICMRKYYHGSRPSRVRIGDYGESDYYWDRGSGSRRRTGFMPPLPRRR